ncbi:MAG: glycosyl hydrolase [Candidatus Ratteibacteria bacterium]
MSEIKKRQKSKVPETLMRPAPFWSWNDKLNEKELRRQIQEMARKGWGSFFMHSRVGLVTGYLSDEWMSLVNACAVQAEKAGVFAWIYDEDKWPSGFAGGLVPEKDPAFRARTVVLLKKGFAAENDTVLAETTWAGEEYEICRRVSPLGDAWFNGACYVDLMNQDAVREFLKSTHEKYKKFCGKHFGKSIIGIFTDEPTYMLWNWGDYEVPAVPWSEHLPGFFRKLKGYDIREKLPLLFFDMDGYRKARFDFYDAVSGLFKKSFTEQYHNWCRRNKLIMTGHFLYEDSLRLQTRHCGDVMSHYELMDWPGADKLGRTVSQLVTIKQVSSAADQLAKERVLCETFGAAGQQVSFFHRKWIGDWQAALGVNFINHHLSLYSMRGERKRDYPPNFFYQQPWWEEEKGFADYQARLCAAVTGGERIVDILLFQPLSSIWCEYSPLHRQDGYSAEEAVDVPFEEISRRLMEEKLDFHYGNENLMVRYGSVKGARIKVGRHFYSCVIIPPGSNLKSSTLRLFQEYLKAAGRLICVGAKPFLVDGVETGVRLDGSVTAESIAEAVAMVAGFFPDRITVTDRRTGKNAVPVYLHSRKVNRSCRHLFVNTDEKQGVDASVKLPAGRNTDTAVFDFCDGRFYRLDTKAGFFSVTLAPAGSILIVCGEEAARAKSKPPLFLGSGAAFSELPPDPPDIMLEKFACEVMEDNVLLLDDFTLEMDGKPVYRGPVCGARHTHFYPAADGTPFSATYVFRSEAVVRKCFAAVEVAENLDSVIFNGAEVKPLKKTGEEGLFRGKKSWKDVSFTKVPLPKIKKGENTLVISGRKSNNITGPGRHDRVNRWQEHRPTEAEEVYICGRFSLKRRSAGQYAVAPFAVPSGRNLTGEGFPFYCGRVKLTAGFNIKLPGRVFSRRGKGKGKVFLRLNGVEAACALVRINGKDCGVLRWEPFLVDISGAVKSGRNVIEIEIATTLVNAFGPNRRAGIKEETRIGPESFVRMEEFTEDYQLFGFGLESAGVYVIKPGGP